MRKTSKVRKTKTSGCVVVGFCGIFAAMSGAAFYQMSWKPLSSLVVARGWAETECVIVSSEVGVNRGGDGSTYRVEIEYTYEVDWQSYRGDRYDFSVGSSSGYKGKARAVEAHPPGTETACYYDPDDPSRSVINRSPGHYLWWSLFPLPFLGVGLGGLLFFITPAGRRKAGAQSKAKDEVQSAASLGDVHGSLELKAQTSPTAKVVGTFVFAAFWNGIVSVFVFGEIIPSFRRGDPEVWLTVFMIPFVLIGLGTIVFFFYQVLAWFNPRPILTVADSHLMPGSETTVRWQFSGRAGRIQMLTIELEGQEKVRYRRGTKTYTDTHVFYSHELVSAGHSSDGRPMGYREPVDRGNATLAVPEGTMPTFDASSNDIEWRLRVHGDIPFWPDVVDDFSITIYPSEQA